MKSRVAQAWKHKAEDTRRGKGQTNHIAHFGAATGEEPDDVAAAAVLELVGGGADGLAALDSSEGMHVNLWLGDWLGHRDGDRGCNERSE